MTPYLIELRIKPESCAFKRFCNTVYTNKTKSRADKQKKNHDFSANCRLKKLSFVLLFYVSELLQIYFIISFCSIYIQTKIYIPAHSRKTNIPSRNKLKTRYPCFVFRCILVSYLIYTIVPINYSPHVGFRRYKRKLDLSTIGLSRSFLPIELKIQMPDMSFEWNLNRFLGNSSWVSFMYIFLKKVLNL